MLARPKISIPKRRVLWLRAARSETAKYGIGFARRKSSDLELREAFNFSDHLYKTSEGPEECLFMMIKIRNDPGVLVSNKR